MTPTWPGLDPERAYAVQPGAVADRANLIDVENARQLTHDACIAHAGMRRRSGIQWLEWDAPAGVATAKKMAAAGCGPADREAWLGIAAFLEASPAGALIVALCEVSP